MLFVALSGFVAGASGHGCDLQTIIACDHDKTCQKMLCHLQEDITTFKQASFKLRFAGLKHVAHSCSGPGSWESGSQHREPVTAWIAGHTTSSCPHGFGSAGQRADTAGVPLFRHFGVGSSSGSSGPFRSIRSLLVQTCLSHGVWTKLDSWVFTCLSVA